MNYHFGDYKQLLVWQKSMDLVDLVFDLTNVFPKEHSYGLVHQIRKSVVSIPSNIAEGRKRGSIPEFRKFIRIAYGSGAELETQLLISLRQGLVSHSKFEIANKLLNEVMSMLNGLQKKYHSVS